MRTTAAVATNSACAVCSLLTATTTATATATSQVVCSVRFVAVILDACGGAWSALVLPAASMTTVKFILHICAEWALELCANCWRSSDTGVSKAKGRTAT